MDFSFQVALMGAPGSGISELIKAELEDAKGSATVRCTNDAGISVYEKAYRVGQYKYLVRILDIPGQQRFLKRAQYYCAGSSALVFCFDVADANSLESLRDWISLASQDHEKDITKALVSTNCDAKDRKVAVKDAEKLARKYDMKLFKTDVSSGKGVRTLFQSVVGAVAEAVEARGVEPASMPKQVKICAKLLENEEFKESLYEGQIKSRS